MTLTATRTNTLLCTLLLIMFAVGATASAESWNGRYVYEANYGNSHGGTPIQARYEIVLSERHHTCEIRVSGYQTDEDILCTARKSQHTIQLLFRSYSTGDTKNIYGVAVYKPNQPLLALEQGADGHTENPITHWLGMKGLDNKQPKPGIYFRKTSAKGDGG